MPLIETPEQATRLARAICSDVSLYNEEKIVRGIEQDNFFDALRDELEEGRELYRSRSPPTSTRRRTSTTAPSSTSSCARRAT